MNAAGRFTYLSACCRCILYSVCVSLVPLYDIFYIARHLTVPLTVCAPIEFVSCIKQKKGLTVLLSDRPCCNNSWCYC